MKFGPEITAALKSYVYVYIDPRNGKPFYVGKGQGNRAFAHLEESGGSEKLSTIRAIRRAGMEPRIDILRYGLTDSEAALVEAAAIDLLGRPPLTNEMRGFHAGSFGRLSSADVAAMLKAEKVRITHRAILITINQLFSSDMTARELFEATRGIWVVDPDRAGDAELAMAVYQGIVKEVYRIRKWHPAGTLEYRTRDTRGFKRSGRWEFEGDVATDVRDRYVGKSIRWHQGKSKQNPIRYVNV